jgi:hypothetical protein
MSFDNFPYKSENYKPLERPEPIIKVDGLAAIVFERSDLDLAEKFLVDFGLVVARREQGVLYMRGTGSYPYCYIVKRGASDKFVGPIYRVDQREKLERIASEMDVSIEPTGRAGGGECVCLTDPNDFQVEIEYGVEEVDELDTRELPFVPNSPKFKHRINEGVRPPLQPSPVVKVGHWVARSPAFVESVSWYMRHLGLIATDVACLQDGTPMLAFLRCDLGDEPAEHHTTVFAFYPETTFAHCAFEVVDLDAIGQGQQFLQSRQWTHHWGIGRHFLGSQIFDYWKDPWGDEHEHYADSDVFTADRETHYYDAGPKNLWLWGQDLPKRKVDQATTTVDRLSMTDRQQDLLDKVQQESFAPPRPWFNSK